jgi:type IV pilus assembly protein PilX
MIQSRQLKSLQSSRKQRGVVLVVALIFLLLLTILALSATGRSLLQERMAGGLRNAQQAGMSADNALRGAEWKLWTLTSKVGGHLNCLMGSISSDDGCTIYNPGNPPYTPTGDVTVFQTSQGWISTIGQTYKGPSGTVDYTSSSWQKTAALAKNPMYIIEDMGRELAPGSGPQHESGDTGPNNIGPGQVNTHIFRITARATGANPNTVRVLQSTFDAQANN